MGDDDPSVRESGVGGTSPPGYRMTAAFLRTGS
jgi:hypothetical protein